MKRQLPLIGLQATLARDECDSIILCGSSSAKSQVFERISDNHWVNHRNPDHFLTDEDVFESVHKGLENDFDSAQCVLRNENVLYLAFNGKVTIERSNRLVNQADSTEGLESLFSALGIKGASRKDKIRQSIHFSRIVINALKKKTKRLRILDLACGRSYLGFVVSHILSRKGYHVELHGIDINEKLINKCSELAEYANVLGASFEKLYKN